MRDVLLADLPSWPGAHTGTGANDHLHLWAVYSTPHASTPPLLGVVVACQICGVRRRGVIDA